MRRVLALALMIAALLCMAGCGGEVKKEELAQEIRTWFSECESLDMVLDIKADYGDRVYNYSVKYQQAGDSGSITVIAPEEVAGISVSFDSSFSRLEYDGASLETGSLDESGLSPVSAVPMLISQWKSGYIAQTSYEKNGEINALAVTTAAGGDILQTTWFDALTHLPAKAEISSGGRTVIYCVFYDVKVA